MVEVKRRCAFACRPVTTECMPADSILVLQAGSRKLPHDSIFSQWVTSHLVLLQGMSLSLAETASHEGYTTGTEHCQSLLVVFESKLSLSII